MTVLSNDGAEWVPPNREVQVGATSQVSGLYDAMELDKLVESVAIDALRHRGLNAVPARGGKGAAGGYDVALEWILHNGQLFGPWLKLLISAVRIVPKLKSVLANHLKSRAQKTLQAHRPSVIIWIYATSKESPQTAFQMHTSSSVASLLALSEGFHSEMVKALPHVRLGLEVSATNRENRRTIVSFGWNAPTARLCMKLLRLAETGESRLLRVEPRLLRPRRVEAIPRQDYGV